MLRMTEEAKPFRAWINQPSTLQSEHDNHGRNVIALHEYDDTFRIYFLDGAVESQQVFGSALSRGWKQQNFGGQ